MTVALHLTVIEMCIDTDGAKEKGVVARYQIADQIYPHSGNSRLSELKKRRVYRIATPLVCLLTAFLE